MDPARLARSWQGRLPGAAMLALERAARGLPGPAQVAAAQVAAAQVADTIADSSSDPLIRGLGRRRARARAVIHDVRAALAAADLAAAANGLAAARDIAAPLADPWVEAWIELFESELAASHGELGAAARHSSSAEKSARRAGDAATFLSVYWCRAVRALRRGNGGDGELVARWMDTWLAAVSPHANLRLRCFAAAFALDDERPSRAIDVAAAVVGAAPGTLEAALCGSIVSQAFLALDRVSDAARIATSSIVRGPELPPLVAARLYHDAAIALDQAGAVAEAQRCAELAVRLDPQVAAPPSAADFAVVGLEAHLL
ncbi:MAG TPA: hypothetical protein VM261_14290 [Kofleriaceae bacterium]|nr:hypothetical protein [Kofleriaceae bacterium]